MARKSGVSTTYPNLVFGAPASDPAAQALAHLANAKALEALDTKPPELESPATRLTTQVMDKVGTAVGELIAQNVKPPSVPSMVDDHLKLTQAQREHYDDLIERQKDLITSYEDKIEDLKQQLSSAYQSGYKEADEKWQTRWEMSERMGARLDEIEKKLQAKELEDKQKLVEARDAQINRLLEELNRERESLRDAYTQLNNLKLERLRLEYDLEKKDLEYRVKQAESQVPRAKTPQEIYEEAYAKAEGIKAQASAELDIEKKRKEIEREEEESRARTAVYEQFGSLLSGIAKQAPDLITAFVSGSAPSRGYGPPAAQAPQAPPPVPLRREAHA